MCCLTNDSQRVEGDGTSEVRRWVSLWAQQGIVDNALNDLRTLVLVCRELDDYEDVVEHSEFAVSLVDKLDEGPPDDHR